MSFNKLLALLQFECIITLTHQSIAGVTYMDHFDFEERYRDMNECDPIYWHPLHLPQKCMEMYQKVIRSKLASKLNSPVRIMTEREEDDEIYKRPREYESSDESIEPELIQMANNDGFVAERAILSDSYLKSLSPYNRMLALLERDVMNSPTAPIIGMVPHFGPVAVYSQPVSRQSEIMMKVMAKAYADAGATPFSKPKASMRVITQTSDGKVKKKNYNFDADEGWNDKKNRKNNAVKNGNLLSIVQQP